MGCVLFGTQPLFFLLSMYQIWYTGLKFYIKKIPQNIDNQWIFLIYICAVDKYSGRCCQHKIDNSMYKETDSALLVTMTKGELKELIADILGEVMKERTLPAQRQSTNLVYGLRGIRELFGVSHKTAQAYKDGIIKEAVRQNGRKIVVDADYALELFNQRSSK